MAQRQGRAGLAHLGSELDGLGNASPWTLLTTWLFERSDYLRPLLVADDAMAQQKLIAIYQLLKVCGEQAALATPAARRFLARVRRIEALNEDTSTARSLPKRPTWTPCASDHPRQQGSGIRRRPFSGARDALHADQPAGRPLPAAADACRISRCSRAITRPRRSACSSSACRGRGITSLLAAPSATPRQNASAVEVSDVDRQRRPRSHGIRLGRHVRPARAVYAAGAPRRLPGARARPL